MTKPRAVCTHDRRIGVPDVLVYQLTEGPGAGTCLPVPPTYKSHPRPSDIGPRGPLTRPSCAYLIRVLDQAAYEKLEQLGFWRSDLHVGWPQKAVDERPAPGA